MNKQIVMIIKPILISILCYIFFASPVFADSRLKDIAQIVGVRKNQLVGYGLVVGLNGTGDKNLPVTTQSAANMLKNLGVTMPTGAFKMKNVASVIVTADLPPFARSGSLLDVTVASLGDATSLAGGFLVMTTLAAADNQVYAVAQGSIVIGAGELIGKDAHRTLGRIPSGATVEKEVQFSLVDPATNTFDIALARPDVATAAAIARTIDKKFGTGTARAVTPGTVQVNVKPEWTNIIAIWSEMEALTVPVDVVARIVVDERTGSVVMGGNVKVLPVAIAYGSLTVNIAESSKGKTKDDVAVNESKGPSIAQLNQESSVSELISLLNSLGAAPKDVVGILISLKNSGALLAELEIM